MISARTCQLLGSGGVGARGLRLLRVKRESNFLDAAYQGLLFSGAPDARRYVNSDRSNCQVIYERARVRLVKLPTHICNVIDGIGVAWLVDGTRYFSWVVLYDSFAYARVQLGE